jgi:hypothetical protein
MGFVSEHIHTQDEWDQNHSHRRPPPCLARVIQYHFVGLFHLGLSFSLRFTVGVCLCVCIILLCAPKLCVYTGIVVS